MNLIAPGQEPLICSVVVARNEQATLEICLAAIRRELDSVGGGEILLVDSGSTDRTPELGLEAGCQVLSVRRASRMCPSAMRYLGAQRTRSRYILFLDGDCELEPGFLPAALEAMSVDASLGVVAGRRRDFYRSLDGRLQPAEREYYADKAVKAPADPGYGGCALYRRRALEEAGSFDPFLRAKEEQDLAQRIRAAGYHTHVLPIPMIRHMTVPRESARRLIRSLNHGFFVGRGEATRKFIGRGEFQAALRGLEKVLFLYGWVVLGIASLVMMSLGIRWPVALWSGVSVGGFVAFAIRTRGILRATYYLSEWLVQAVCLGIGLLVPRHAASSFRWEGEALSPSGRRDPSLPRVLLVGPLPQPPLKGGVEKGVGLLLSGDLARRASLQLFNTFRSPDPGRPFLQRLKYQAGMIRSFRRVLREMRPDLVHVKTSSGINFFQNSLYVLVARLSGFPVLLQIHSGRFEDFYRGCSSPLRAWIRSILARANRVAVLSDSWGRRIGALAPKARIRVVPNGLPREELNRLASNGHSGRSQVVFLGTGREELNRDKGLEDLLAILPDLWRTHPQSRWVIAGLHDSNATHAWLRDKGIGDGADSRVRCLGILDSSEKERLLRESSILAFPSYFENMPNVLLEAMASGLGVVATDVGAIPEMLGEEGGILCHPGDRSALSEALGKLLSSPEIAESQGRRNVETVSTFYTMEVVESSLENLYLEILGAPHENASRTVRDASPRSDSVPRTRVTPSGRPAARP
jgi:glycosyltransferase involved in cell wall biosynthesis